MSNIIQDKDNLIIDNNITINKELYDSVEAEAIDNNENEIDNNKTTLNFNKKLSLLSDLKYLTCNICKKNQDFIIDNLLNIHINNNIYKLLNINTFNITSSTLLSEIYLYIMEGYLKNNDFNISITFKNIDPLSTTCENLNLNFFGSIPIYDENSNKIIFYKDLESVNNYIKSLNKNIDKETIETYTKLEKLCELKKKTHSMANKHYLCMNKYLLIPSIILSSTSGVVSFLASSEYFKNLNLIFTISVGVAASINTLFQSFGNAFEFSTKAEAHANATESYDQLLTQIRFEKMTPNLKPEIFINTIEKQILDTKQRCKYVIPEDIENLYNENKFHNYKEDILRDLMKKFIILKTDLYYDSVKSTENYKDINFKNIEHELGFNDIKEHDDWCKQKTHKNNICCCV